MIKVTALNKVYNVPTSWKDINYKQWMSIQGDENELSIVSKLTNIPTEVLTHISEDSTLKLVSVLSFINTDINLLSETDPRETTIDKRVIPVVDIREQTYGQKIMIHELLKGSSDKLFDIIPEVIIIYSQPFIDNDKFDNNRVKELLNLVDDMPIISAYSVAMKYINQLKEIIELEVAQLNSQPNHDQRLAGIDMFDEFGVMNTIKALAMGNILNYDKVLQLEYNVVFMHLKMTKADNIFKENYAKVLQRKRK